MVDLLKRWRAGRQWAIIMGTACLGVATSHGRPCWGQGAAATQAARAYGIVTARAYGIEIGRETTYLTDPLLADGMVDYAAAMNAEAGKGVTPENNAACLMARIVRPDEDQWSQTHRKTHDEVLAMMGVDAKAGKATWTESPDKLDQMAAARGAASRPWKAAEMPELAAWLESNKAGMALFVEASRRREWWNPATQSPTWLEPAESGLWRNARGAAGAMWLRSMLKLGEGDVMGAWEDLATCERMAGLMARSPDLISRMLAGGIHNGTMEAMWGMVEHGELSAEMLQRMDALLREQRTWPMGGEVIPQSERYQFLVQVAYWAKGMQKAMDKGGNGMTEKLQTAGLKLPDWNRIMRLGNRMFDMVQADETRMSAQERAEHRRAVAARISELEVIHRESKSKMRADGTMDETWLLPQAGETQDAYSDRVGAVVIMMMMPPNAEKSGRFFDVCNGRTAWTRVAVALLRYRQDRGGYPADLKALAPGYLTVVPEANANGPMRYERTAKGFALTNETGATTREGTKMQKITIHRER